VTTGVFPGAIAARLGDPARHVHQLTITESRPENEEDSQMTPTSEAQGLTKRFGKAVALDGLDLVADAGQVVAVLGPNGAGKTTLVRALATVLALEG
jgi:ATPase subunit of ABC transporter with duplicated ATPase domains